MELPFAGHPTIGTAFILARLGRVRSSTFSLQEKICRIPITFEGDLHSPTMIWMQQPLPTFGPPIGARSEVMARLGLAEQDLLDVPIRVGSAGVPFVYVGLRDPEAVDRARVIDKDFRGMAAFNAAQGIFLFCPIPDALCATVHSRMLGSEQLGIREDPATGSASGPLGVYLVDEGIVPRGPNVRIISRQGIRMGRPSEVLIDLELVHNRVTRVQVGGCSVSVLDGVVHLP